MILRGPRPIELLGGAFVLAGLLAYLLIDVSDPSWGDECRAIECPQPEAWERPATVQALLVILGFFGLGLLLWGIIQRERDESP